MKKALLLLALFLAIGLGVGWTPNISHEELKQRYATPPSDFLTLDSGAVAHYRDYGPKDAPALVLLHGSAASLYTWDAWLLHLPKDLRVLSVDFPGHGLTGATPQKEYWIKGLTDFLEEFIDKLGLENIALAGNSMGGGIATSYVLRRPENVAALILIDADGLPEDLYEDIDSPTGFSIAHTPGLRWLATRITPRFLVRDALDNVSENPDILTEDAIDRYWHLLRHPGNREAMIDRFKAAKAQPMNHVFEAVQAPTLVLWGRRDRLIPLANGEAMAQRIPRSELIIYEDVGHLPQEEIPQRSATDTISFLTSHGFYATVDPAISSGE